MRDVLNQTMILNTQKIDFIQENSDQALASSISVNPADLYSLLQFYAGKTNDLSIQGKIQKAKKSLI
jgi:hypothetical protein